MNLSSFKLRQHFIYIVGMILVAALLHEGAFLSVLLCFVYFKRFPRSYFFYFLIATFAFGWLEKNLQVETFEVKMGEQLYEAEVLHVKPSSAVIKLDETLLYLTVGEDAPRLTPGDQIQVIGEMKLPSNSTIPHGFSFKDYLKSRGIGLTLYGKEVRIVGHHWSMWQLQHEASRWVNHHFPPLTATYLNAWFLGQGDDLSEGVRGAYAQLGIIHLFAISGLHVQLLVGILQMSLRRLGMLKEILTGLLLCLLFFFIVITGGSPSIVRASLMMSLSLLNKQFKWRLSSLDCLSLVFIGSFLINPLQLYHIGFIYSYWLTWMLICSQQLFKSMTPIGRFLFLPFLAQLAALPIQLTLQYEVNLGGYVANLVMVPLVTVFLMPALGVVVVIQPLSLVTEWLLGWFEQLNLWAAEWLYFPWVSGEIALEVVILLMGCLLVACWQMEQGWKKKRWVVALGIMILIIEGQRLWQLENQLTVLDVGQGESLIIQSAFGGCVSVVDTGGKFSITGETTSIFSKTLEPYLLGEGVRVIDYLILTHGDVDHINEAEKLLNRFVVKHLVISEATPTERLQQVLVAAEESNTKIKVLQTNDKLTCGNQTLTFLQPPAQSNTENEDSLVIALKIHDFTALLTGDMPHAVESAVLNVYPYQKLDLYKVAHHGSKHSNSEEFLKALNPTHAVVSAGRKNLYNHPSQELLEVIETLDLPLFNTQSDGTVQFKINTTEYNIYTFPPF